MKKLWSLSTTVREVDRILPFLRVLQEMEGEEFDEEGQIKYQTLLLQNRLYSPTGLSEDQSKYYETTSDKMSFEEAKELFEHMRSNSKELQKTPGLRGRVSVAILTKMGLAIAKKTGGKVVITNTGKALLKDKISIGEVVLKFFLKWQLPTPGSNGYGAEEGYNIKPFMGVINLIDSVNRKYENLIGTGKAKGISFWEFDVFVPALINHKDIDSYADKIIELRKLLMSKKLSEQKNIKKSFILRFATEFLGSGTPKEVAKTIKNMGEYGDNARRYLRSTGYFRIRGRLNEFKTGGNHFDLTPLRRIEIDKLLSGYSAEAELWETPDDYIAYLGDVNKPELPWENIADLKKIISILMSDIEGLKKNAPDFKVAIEVPKEQTINDLKIFILNLKQIRRDVQEYIEHGESQNIDILTSYIEILDNIYSFEENRPIILEKYCSLGLNALNDAIKIKPNYPVGDDNEPTSTAGANMPDIECYYKGFSAICEVTMLKSRDQWYNEGQPVMGHLRDFEEKTEGISYCLFIAPTLHRGTINSFWTSVKYEYEGEKQKIVPLTIKQFVSILKILKKLKTKGIEFDRHKLKLLYDNIISLTDIATTSVEWIEKIPETITAWEDQILA